jgi:hypothetical protein
MADRQADRHSDQQAGRQTDIQTGTRHNTAISRFPPNNERLAAREPKPEDRFRQIQANGERTPDTVATPAPVTLDLTQECSHQPANLPRNQAASPPSFR